MSKPLVLITRPEEGAEQLSGLMEQHGFASFIEPMMFLHPVAQAAPGIERNIKSRLQGTIITSRHALPALEGLPKLKNLPLFAVGEATAAAATHQGFRQVSHRPDAHMLLKYILSHCKPSTSEPLLYARGQHVSYNIGSVLSRQGFAISEAIVYQVRPARALSESLRAALNDGTIFAATFLSARTAEIFLHLVAETPHTPALSRIRAVAFSHAIAEKLTPATWQNIHTCEQPSLESLMAEMDKLAPQG